MSNKSRHSKCPTSTAFNHHLSVSKGSEVLTQDFIFLQPQRQRSPTVKVLFLFLWRFFFFFFFPHCILKIKKFQVTDKKSVQAEARVLRKTFFVFSPKISHRSTPKCPPPPQPPPPSCPSSPPLSSFGGIWSGSCHRIGTGRSGKASPVLRLHLVGFPGPGDPRLRQTSASFLDSENSKTVKTDTWQYNLQFLIIIKRILYMCFY